MVNFLQTKNLFLISKTYWQILSVVFMSGFLLTTLFLGQFLWLYFITLTVCLIAALMSPKAGFYTIFICTMWFERHFTLQELYWGETSFKIYPLDFIILFTVIGVLVGFFAKREPIKIKKFDIYILLFGLLCTFGFVMAFIKHAEFAYAFSTYKNYFLYSVIYFLGCAILRTKKDWQEFMLWFTVGGLGTFFFLFYGILAGAGLWSEYTPLSTSGSRLIAGTHVFFLLLFGFWAFSNWLFKTPLILRWGKTGDLVIIFLVILALLVSLVRHLWLALLVIGFLWLVFFAVRERRKCINLLKRVLLFGTAAAVIFLWVFSLVSGNIPQSLVKMKYILASRASLTNVLSMQDDSFRWRVNAWLAGFELWKTSPVLGVGLGQLVIGTDKDTIYEVPVRELHNDYLGVLIQLGVLGLTFTAFWFLYIVLQLYKIWKKLREERMFNAKLFFTWGTTVLLFMIVFSVSVYWDLNIFLIWWWLALSAIRYLRYEGIANK